MTARGHDSLMLPGSPQVPAWSGTGRASWPHIVMVLLLLGSPGRLAGAAWIGAAGKHSPP